MSACEFSLGLSFWKYYQLEYSCFPPSRVQTLGQEWVGSPVLAGLWPGEHGLALAQVGVTDASPVLPFCSLFFSPHSTSHSV